MSGKTSTDSKRKYNEKAYDRLSITVPKGQLLTIKQAAEAEGLSVNAFTQKALLHEMKIEEWPSVKVETDENICKQTGV